MIKRCFGVLAAAIVALGITAPKAEAVVIYDWTGTCATGCAGQASAVLTLADSYTPGTALEDADFISFSYSSSSGSYAIPTDAAFDGFLGTNVLPEVSGGTFFTLIFDWSDAEFSGRPNTWLNFVTPAQIRDFGFANTWTLRQPTELSAPGPLPLLALGLAGLALAGRRRKQG